MVTYFLSSFYVAHDSLAQQPQSILTPRLYRVVVSIPQTLFMWEERKTSWDNEVTKPEQNGWMTALGSNWLSSLLRSRSGILKTFLTHSNFFMIQLKPKRGHFCVSFHPSPHHLKLSCRVHSSLLHHSCYCHSLAMWNQPPCCRLCSAPWHFASCNT